ncbi:PREDICTED: uncharacterized protein LOC109222091 [Nicotiana attenuata]|uniref:uncharacterized protein LOC109222091 n=1 Tax=Nicotiana attenuata TaxID=49451 RepID=UPI00090559FC|nr:PREDICTED: uncharacterized protein LOC109222091 [Nicotiana attenuata]
MRRQTKLVVSCEEVLKVKPYTMIYTKERDKDEESLGSSYHVTVQGENGVSSSMEDNTELEDPNGFFRSTRGVKQGDPLSPTLFILAAEAMSRGLNSLHSTRQFKSFGMPKWSPKINHLAYADDTIIFTSSDPM